MVESSNNDIVSVPVGTLVQQEHLLTLYSGPGTAGETADYICTQHPNMGAAVTINTGTAGNYGSGLSLDIVVRSGGSMLKK